jgi:hypothetical protein
MFEGYIARSLREEVDRIADYYGEKGGAFWVAVAEIRDTSWCGKKLPSRRATRIGALIGPRDGITAHVR